MKHLLFLTLFFSTLSHANTYFIEEATGPVSKDDLATVTVLIKSVVTELGHTQSQIKDAKFILKPKLLKLGNAYILSIDKTEGGKLTYSSQLKSLKVEDLDEVAKRVARSVIKEVPIREDARVSDVTEVESKEGTRRREARQHLYVTFGPAGAINMESSGAYYSLGLGNLWDLGRFGVKLFWEGAFASAGGNKGTFSDIGIGMNYYLTERDSTALVSADVGYATVSPFGATGYALGAGAGYQIFRTASVNLEAMLHYTILLNSGAKGTPSVYTLRLGLYL